MATGEHRTRLTGPSSARGSGTGGLDTPEDSPESDFDGGAVSPTKRLAQPILTLPPPRELPYPSPPPSPCPPTPPVDEAAARTITRARAEPYLGQPVEGAPPLPPSAMSNVMQGYVAPPSLPPSDRPPSRTSYPPATTLSRSLPPVPSHAAVRHLSAPLALASQPYMLPTLQNDLFSTGDSPYPRPRRVEPDVESPVSYAVPASPRASLLSGTPKRASGPKQPSPVLGTTAAPPPPAEVCVECMMRDRDMADVDVLSPGVWDRSSDVDYLDALRADDLADRKEAERARRRGSLGGSSSRAHATSGTDDEQSLRWSSARSQTPDHLSRADGGGGGASSRESASLEHARSRPRRIGRGHELTAPALKLWTSMKPPASSHRWKTLQAYLKEQNRLLALERAGQVASEQERDRFESVLREKASFSLDTSRPGTPKAKRKSFVASRNRASTILPSGITVERVDVAKDEKEARSRWKASQKPKRRRASSSSPTLPFGPGHPYGQASHYPGASSSASLRSAPLSDLRPPSMPVASQRRFSSPLLDGGSPRGHSMYARSSADLRSSSPAGTRPASLAPSERPRSFFSRGPKSASASVLSFAPSGSMIDMHLGLSMDKHLPSRPDDEYFQPGGGAAGRSDEDGQGATSTKKKRRTLGKILSRLNLKSAPPSPAIPPQQAFSFSPRASASVFATSPDEEEPLEPPFPSYLAGDPAAHRRSPTVSTASTSPITPDLTQLPPSTDPSSSSSQLPLRREKSLPALPVDLDYVDAAGSTLSVNRPTYGLYDRSVSAPSAGAIPTRSSYLDYGAAGGVVTPSSESTEHIGGGRKAKAAKVPHRATMFGFFKRSNGVPASLKSSPPPPSHRDRDSHPVTTTAYEDPFDADLEKAFTRAGGGGTMTTADYAPHGGTLDAVVRDAHFVATRYPSLSP